MVNSSVHSFDLLINFIMLHFYHLNLDHTRVGNVTIYMYAPRLKIEHAPRLINAGNYHLDGERQAVTTCALPTNTRPTTGFDILSF